MAEEVQIRGTQEIAKIRNPLAPALLGFVTFFIYNLVWYYKINKEMSKEEILAGYLNTIYFGHGAYGLQAASKEYFGINAKKLTVPQAAFLATVVNNPSMYDPRDDDDQSRPLEDVPHGDRGAPDPEQLADPVCERSGDDDRLHTTVPIPADRLDAVNAVRRRDVPSARRTQVAVTGW